MIITDTGYWAIIGTIIGAIIAIYLYQENDKKNDLILESIRQVNIPGRPAVIDFIDGYPHLLDNTIRETFELALKFREQKKYDTADRNTPYSASLQSDKGTKYCSPLVNWKHSIFKRRLSICKKESK